MAPRLAAGYYLVVALAAVSLTARGEKLDEYPFAVLLLVLLLPPIVAMAFEDRAVCRDGRAALRE